MTGVNDMAFESNFVSIIGNITRDPELRFTSNGVPVGSLTVAWNPKEGEPVFIPVTCWRDLAENVANKLNKGARVHVVGQLKLAKWSDKDGTERERIEIVADEVSLSNRFGERQSQSGTSHEVRF
jgi:single-strand DNA-binding protein